MATLNSPDETPRRRVALYGHDTLGLGHLRRNLALASTFAADLPDDPGADVLLLTGASEVGMFERPEGVDALVVPGVQKDDAGGYSPRQLRTHLDMVVQMRRSMLTNALLTYLPDLLVVDKAAWGFGDELADVLPALREYGTKLVLGLRDVMDDPETATRQWHEDGSDQAVREVYDEVWIYGDQDVHDVTVACGMSPETAAKCRHMGYLSEGRPNWDSTHRPLGDRPYVLVALGGGQDGEAVALAATGLKPTDEYDVVILTGPQMPAETISQVRRAAEKVPGMHVHRFSRHGSAWAAHAEAVICMGGANTIAEQLVTDVPTLSVPRVTPRLEQWVRADSLSKRGYLDVLHPDELSTEKLQEWVDANASLKVDRSSLRLDGLRVVRMRAEEMVLGAVLADTGSFPATADLATAAADATFDAVDADSEQTAAADEAAKASADAAAYAGAADAAAASAAASAADASSAAATTANVTATNATSASTGASAQPAPASVSGPAATPISFAASLAAVRRSKPINRREGAGSVVRPFVLRTSMHSPPLEEGVPA